jgi:N-terminal domain of (some) glycogen debranching enzymes
VLDGSTLFVSRRDGDCPTSQETGFFHQDVRHLSVWQLLTSRNDAYYSARVFGTLASAGVGRDPPVSVRPDRVVADGLREDLRVDNHSSTPRTLAVELRVEVDFADILEVKSGRSKQGRCRAEPGQRQLTLTYERDGCRRATIVSVDRPCQASDDRLRFQVELAPHQHWPSGPCSAWTWSTGGCGATRCCPTACPTWSCGASRSAAAEGPPNPHPIEPTRSKEASHDHRPAPEQAVPAHLPTLPPHLGDHLPGRHHARRRRRPRALLPRRGAGHRPRIDALPPLWRPAGGHPAQPTGVAAMPRILQAGLWGLIAGSALLVGGRAHRHRHRLRGRRGHLQRRQTCTWPAGGPSTASAPTAAALRGRGRRQRAGHRPSGPCWTVVGFLAAFMLSKLGSS